MKLMLGVVDAESAGRFAAGILGLFDMMIEMSV